MHGLLHRLCIPWSMIMSILKTWIHANQMKTIQYLKLELPALACPFPASILQNARLFAVFICAGFLQFHICAVIAIAHQVMRGFCILACAVFAILPICVFCNFAHAIVLPSQIALFGDIAHKLIFERTWYIIPFYICWEIYLGGTSCWDKCLCMYGSEKRN